MVVVAARSAYGNEVPAEVRFPPGPLTTDANAVLRLATMVLYLPQDVVLREDNSARSRVGDWRWSARSYRDCFVQIGLVRFPRRGGTSTWCTDVPDRWFNLAAPAG